MYVYINNMYYTHTHMRAHVAHTGICTRRSALTPVPLASTPSPHRLLYTLRPVLTMSNTDGNNSNNSNNSKENKENAAPDSPPRIDLGEPAMDPDLDKIRVRSLRFEYHGGRKERGLRVRVLEKVHRRNARHRILENWGKEEKTPTVTSPRPVPLRRSKTTVCGPN